MYKKRISVKVADCDLVSINPFAPDVRVARPISYFVKGGVDLSGTASRPPLPGTFADKESIATGDIDISTDPTVGRLDILDYAQTLVSEHEKASAEDLADAD